MNWIYTFENRIYTIIKTRVEKSLKTDYLNLTFTMDDEPSDPTNHFPTVLIHFLPSAEQGATLDGEGINAIISSVQIDVSSNKTQGQKVARQVMWEVVDEFKRLRYQVKMMPEVINTGNDTNRVVCRMSRMVGANDIVG